MDMHNAARYLPLVKALSEGKTIERDIGGTWVATSGVLNFTNPPERYRVKPDIKKSVGYRRYLYRSVYESGETAKARAGVIWETAIYSQAAMNGFGLFIKWIDTEWQYEEYEE